MSDTPAAATPAPLEPLTQDEIAAMRARHVDRCEFCAYHAEQGLCHDCGYESPCDTTKVLSALDAAVARADAAERERYTWEETAIDRDATLAVTAKVLAAARADLAEAWRQARESHAAMLVAMADRDTERQRADAVTREYKESCESAFQAKERWIRSNDALGDRVLKAEAALATERARGERLAMGMRRLAHKQDLSGEVIAGIAELARILTPNPDAVATLRWLGLSEPAAPPPAAEPDAARLTHAIERVIAGLQEQPDVAQQTVVRWALVVLARALEGSEPVFIGGADIDWSQIPPGPPGSITFEPAPADQTAATAAQAQGE